MKKESRIGDVSAPLDMTKEGRVGFISERLLQVKADNVDKRNITSLFLKGYNR